MGEAVVADPITAASVAGVLLTCGMCGGGIEVGGEDINDDEGGLEPWAVFGECPSCGAIYDASCLKFNVSLGEKLYAS